MRLPTVFYQPTPAVRGGPVVRIQDGDLVVLCVSHLLVVAAHGSASLRSSFAIGGSAEHKAPQADTLGLWWGGALGCGGDLRLRQKGEKQDEWVRDRYRKETKIMRGSAPQIPSPSTSGKMRFFVCCLHLSMVIHL